MKRIAAGILLLIFPVLFVYADGYTRQPSIDILHYEIAVVLTENSDAITGTAGIEAAVRSPISSGMWLDFVGMHVDSLKVGGTDIPFVHDNGKLRFSFDRTYRNNETVSIEVAYHGIPGEVGLRIGKNHSGRRVFFADNWPDYARSWFPSIDHPSDKATVDFIVTAPGRYMVVANGQLAGTRLLEDGRKETRWSEHYPVPTYSMVIGVAEFAVHKASGDQGIPVGWYAYPEDAGAAERQFGGTDRMLRFFSSSIGNYPFEKLFQVESTTRMLAMENADTIFYSESLFGSPDMTDAPVPHEIAHQWFGNSITPSDWDHLWLSEGFATYFDALYTGYASGTPAFREKMDSYAARIFSYSPGRIRPVVDPEITDLFEKLNPLVYEKGAWVLHMLRGMLGDRIFFEGIRSYYSRHAYGNVRTEDFRAAMEQASGQDLAQFFRQWIYQPGWPELRAEWEWDEKAGEIILRIEQVQETNPFDMPLEIVLVSDSREDTRRIRIQDRDQRFRIRLDSPPSEIRIDPGGWILKSLSE